jgi:hypothetical protein
MSKNKIVQRRFGLMKIDLNEKELNVINRALTEYEKGLGEGIEIDAFVPEIKKRFVEVKNLNEKIRDIKWQAVQAIIKRNNELEL